MISSKLRQHGGPRPNSGGPRANSGGYRPGSGAKPAPRVIYLPRADIARWYCARTCYAGEAAAAEEIADAGFEVFAPTIWKPATRARRNAAGAIIPARPAGAGPLFKSYIFTRFRLTDYWQARRDLPSIETILGLTQAAPTPMPDRAVELIRGMCDDGGCFHEHGDAPNSLVGTLVRILDGPMSDFEGPCDWSDGQRVRILLSLFGRPCPVTVDQTAVERV